MRATGRESGPSTNTKPSSVALASIVAFSSASFWFMVPPNVNSTHTVSCPELAEYPNFVVFHGAEGQTKFCRDLRILFGKRHLPQHRYFYRGQVAGILRLSHGNPGMSCPPKLVIPACNPSVVLPDQLGEVSM